MPARVSILTAAWIVASAVCAYAHVTKQDRARNELGNVRQELTNAVSPGGSGNRRDNRNNVFRRDVTVIWMGGGTVQQGHEAAEKMFEEIRGSVDASLNSSSGRRAIDGLEIAEDGRRGAFFGYTNDNRRWTAAVAKDRQSGKWQVESIILESQPGQHSAGEGSNAFWWTLTATLSVTLAMIAVAAYLRFRPKSHADQANATLSRQ